MAISEGDKLPDATLLKMGAEGPEQVTISDLTKGRKIVLFAVPGAFTPTCHMAHMPSFIRTKDQFDAKGVDEIVCVSVNDVFVMNEWAKATGADAAGITVLADADASFSTAMGRVFDAPPAGMYARSVRYALVAEDGVVTSLQIEEGRGVCDLTGGEAMLAQL